MWDDEVFETSDSVRETVDWMDELRANAQAADEDAQRAEQRATSKPPLD